MKIKLYILFFFLIGFEAAYAQSYMNNPEIKISQRKTTRMDVSIFPNPTIDIFHVKSNKSIGKVEIFNIIGKKIKILENKNSNTFDVSDLRNGIYLVRIFDKYNKVLKVIRLGVNKQEP